MMAAETTSTSALLRRSSMTQDTRKRRPATGGSQGGQSGGAQETRVRSQTPSKPQKYQWQGLQAQDRAQKTSKGYKLSNAYNNVGSFGSDTWRTTYADFGDYDLPRRPAKSAALTSFAMMMYLPNHPHWKTKPNADSSSWHTDSMAYGSHARQNTDVRTMDHTKWIPKFGV